VTFANVASRGSSGGGEARVVTHLKGTQTGATPPQRQKPAPLMTATDPAIGPGLDKGVDPLFESVARCLQPSEADGH
jgi:hypothetical protein